MPASPTLSLAHQSAKFSVSEVSSRSPLFFLHPGRGKGGVSKGGGQLFLQVLPRLERQFREVDTDQHLNLFCMCICLGYEPLQ